MADMLPNARLAARLQVLSRLAAIGVIAVGGLVALGWLLNIASLIHIFPGSIAMKFNTALCFIFSGVTLARLHMGSPRLNLVLSTVVAVVGILTLVEYAFHWNIGIDQWLVHDAQELPQPAVPGRMSPVSALNFVLIGTSLLFMARSRRLVLAQLLLPVAAFTALLSLLGYVYGAPELFQIGAFTPIALPTAVVFVILGLGIFFAYPEHGLAGLIVSDRAGGLLARRLLPAVVVIPVIIGWLRLKGQQAGLYDTEFGLALFALSNIVVFTLLILRAAGAMNRLDSQRRQATEALHQANTQLESRVHERTAELRTSEALLQQSEAKFSAAFRVGPAAMSIATLPDGRWTEVNDAIAKMTGYSKEELLGHSPDELGLVDDVARATFAESFRTKGFVRDVEVQMRTKSNEIRDVLVSAEQIDINGQMCALTIQYDITELKRAQSALQESEERYRALFDNAPIGISIGYGAVRTYVNGAFMRMFGYDDMTEVLNSSALDQVAPESRQEITERLTVDPLPEQSIIFESVGRKKDGTLFAVQIQLARLELAAGTRRVIFVSDISERKRGEATLRENEQKLQTFFQMLPVGVSVMNSTGQITEMNPALERIMGLSQEAIATGANLSRKYIRGDGTPLTLSDFPSARALAEQQTIHDLEIGVVKEDETVVWTSVSAAPLPREHSGAIIVTADITERKRVEAQLAAQGQELVRSNQELEQFAYIASHDLQEPLRMVTSYMGLLSRRYQGKLDEKADMYIGFAVDGATRMQQLINDLLAYSRVGSREPDFSSTDAEKILDTVLHNLRVAVKESRAQISHDAAPTLSADKTQLAQLFQNLIANAIKFHGEAVPQVHISAQQQGSHWLFSIRDNGIGVEPEYHEQIFEIFKRLHTRQEYAGTGLGLAICKKIVERHDGHIWLESEPGKGSTFYFRLPIRSNDL